MWEASQGLSIRRIRAEEGAVVMVRTHPRTEPLSITSAVAENWDQAQAAAVLPVPIVGEKFGYVA